MCVFVYILRDLNDFYYCGITNNIERRVQEHNTHKKGYTNFSKTWAIIYTETYTTRQLAAARERTIKKFGVKRFYLKKVAYR